MLDGCGGLSRRVVLFLQISQSDKWFNEPRWLLNAEMLRLKEAYEEGKISRYRGLGRSREWKEQPCCPVLTPKCFIRERPFRSRAYSISN